MNQTPSKKGWAAANNPTPGSNSSTQQPQFNVNTPSEQDSNYIFENDRNYRKRGPEQVSHPAGRVIKTTAEIMAKRGVVYARDAYRRDFGGADFADKTPAEVRRAREEADQRTRTEAARLLRGEP